MSDDRRQLRPDHHPTPFSAAEIRDAFEVGREVRSLTVRAGAEPYVLVRRNLSADHEAGVYEVWTESTEGVRLSEPEQGRSSWLELQGHASMPADATTIDTVEIDLPMGRYQGLRYTRVIGDAVDTFWFALSLPGAPVRMESRVGGQVVLSSTTVARFASGRRISAGRAVEGAMKLNNLLVVSAVIAAFFGVALVLVPGPLLAIYGMTVDKTGTIVAQLFGSVLIGFAVLNWFARTVTDPEARRAVVLGNLAGDAVGFVVILLGQLSGVANALGWSTVAIYLLLTLAFAYVQFMQRQGV